jgi:hypothetical protein
MSHASKHYTVSQGFSVPALAELATSLPIMLDGMEIATPGECGTHAEKALLFLTVQQLLVQL